MFRSQANSVTHDYSPLFESLDAALHAGARSANEPGQMCGRCAGVLAKRSDQLMVYGVHAEGRSIVSTVLYVTMAIYTLKTSETTLPFATLVSENASDTIPT